MPDPYDFITSNLHFSPAPAIPEIQLYRAHPGSGLSRLVGENGPPPYWAYGWAGGTVLARYILDHPQCVAGRKVLDIGCGSGVVAIAAAKAGATSVIAWDSDAHALAATWLNAKANAVDIEVGESDLTTVPDIDLILGGDVFYSQNVAVRMTAFLDRCVAGGIKVLIGDPYRAFLPLHRLRLVTDSQVPDFGLGELTKAGVFAFGDQGASPLEPID